MCGIAGRARHEPGGDPCLFLRKVQPAIDHRGPDDQGAWVSPAQHAAFAHARLSILDPSPAGHQPMAIDDGRFTIIYNGEIYNFAALRASLTAAGVVFRSNSDTEVILRLYEAEGRECVKRLRGMFAFAIWDERERSCLLARDRFGIKPLYYHAERGMLTFASEVKALLAAGVPAAVNALAAYQYFCTGSVPEPLTLVDGVRALEAGHTMIWKDGRADIRRYWDVAFPDATDDPNPAAVVRAALLDSVAHHFVSDVPVGVFLSGGMDSTAIVALARVHRQGELRTFSLSFPGLSLDEGPEARRTAERFATTHHEWALDGATARGLFDEYLAAADQPSIDGFNTFTVCRLARQHDTKVVLSGLGGDELFGGYPSFRRVPQLTQVGRWARRGGPFGNAGMRLAAAVGGRRLRRLHDLMVSPPTLEGAYGVFRGIFTRDEASTLTRHYLNDAPAEVRSLDTPASNPTDEDAVSRLELTRYMRNQLLRDADVMSMASGVEVRVPFVDGELFDRIARLPAAQRIQTGKALLYQAVPEIPQWVARRPKRGFFLPIERWMASEWSTSLAGLNPPRSVPIDTWYRQMAVLVFERWLKRVAASHV